MLDHESSGATPHCDHPRERRPTSIARPLPDGEQPEGLSRWDIDGAVRDRTAELSACGAEIVAAGYVLLRWGIAPSGEIDELCIRRDEFPSDEVAQCLARVMRAVTFPPTEVRSVVSYPFRFEPSQPRAP